MSENNTSIYGCSMASDLGFVQYICDQLQCLEGISFRKMFGEFALYHEGKVVALVCDNQLFIKPTINGKKLLENVTEAQPYPGAKPYFLITDLIDDKEFLEILVRATSQELPEPKPKRPKQKSIKNA